MLNCGGLFKKFYFESYGIKPLFNGVSFRNFHSSGVLPEK
jgi:hypothetical protein